MIHAIGQDLNDALASRRCPFRVYDATDAKVATNVSFVPERITIERDEDAGDSFTAPKGASPNANPPLRFVRNCGVKFKIYAQSPAVSAKPYEHERRLEHVLDILVCSIHEVANTRKNGFVIGPGKFFRPEDTQASDTKPGAAYEFRVTWERGIRDLGWSGEKKDEVEVGGVDGVDIETVTTVSLPGGTPETL